MAENSGVKKVFLGIGIALLSVVLCYFSVALYFYYARPNDITGKLSVWNLMSDEALGDMYLDSIYEIRYNEESFVGVNVDASGYVLTCNYNFDGYNGEELLLYSKSGAIYSGDLVFSNDVYNLAIIKIYDYFSAEKTLNLPYVKTGSLSSSVFGREYLAIGSIFEDGNVNAVSDVESATGYVTTLYDERTVVDFICLNSISYYVSNYEETSQGAIFNKSGRLVGMTYAYMVDEDNSQNAYYYAVETSQVGDIIAKLKSGNYYEIEIAGFDMQELYIYLLYEINTNQIYFNGRLLTLDDTLIYYYNNSTGVYLTEDFSLNGVTLRENNLITSISYNGFSHSVTTRHDLYETLYSLDAGTSFTLTSIDLSTESVIRTQFVI